MSSLFNPDYLYHLCQKYGLRPSKKYGQNYLIDETVIEKIIEIAELSADDTVVEVGPGFGTLTLAMAPHVKQILAFEIEKKLNEYWNLEIRNKKLENVEVVWGNFIKEFPKYQILDTRYKVVANLPYQITSPVIRLFLEAEQPPSTMILMVQKEVAERICAKPACLDEVGKRRWGDMSVLSVAVQYYADAEIVQIVPRTSFWPVPGVDSAIVKVKSQKSKARPERSEWVESPEKTKRFFQIVKVGFSNRRKLLIKNLEPLVGKKNRKALEEVFDAVGITLQARAQELSVEQWRELVYKVESL